jgi:16S rRNA (guanine(966)-N(2))-methyltransferase RsmD
MGKIRIIGGTHRSRQLTVLDADGLRPTLDRVKETLFNWLGQDLTGQTCLDLFAGSGSLGFEAISRNAQSVTMVEKSSQVAQQLISNVKLLMAENCQIINSEAQRFLAKNSLKFDVIFLDPPYNSALLEQSLRLISPHLAVDGVIYIEYHQNKPDLSQFNILKHSQAGSVNYALLNLKE